jgi:exopolyphosphatase/guanosine-5'-triphosphate,3'-diphosphate pyrophosphatase
MEADTGENSGWQAIADLGSNTFQLLIGRNINGKIEIGFKAKIGVGFGKKSLSNGRITPEAMEKGKNALRKFAGILKEFDLLPADCQTIGTSTFRSIENLDFLKDEIKKETGFQIQVIDGQREADLIFTGVRASGALRREETQLVIDIGGGSVEFIKCDGLNPVWKHSFEMGGIRLMEQFHTIDPIPAYLQKDLTEYILKRLEPLWQQFKETETPVLVGCSGSFDTLVDMLNFEQNRPNAQSQPHQNMELKDFERLAGKLISSPLEKRLNMGGMIPLRAEMIVVAVLLVQVVVQKLAVSKIRVSTFSLKEGFLYELFGETKNKRLAF